LRDSGKSAAGLITAACYSGIGTR